MKRCFFYIIGWLLLLFTTSCERCQESGSCKVVKIDNEGFFASMKPYLLRGYEVSMVPKGRSMLPTIQDNTDIVTLRAKDKVKVGDVVLAEIDTGHYVMHRIVEIRGQEVTLKGDHNKNVEHTVLSHIVACMVGLQSGGGQRGKASQQVDLAKSFRVRPHCRFDTIHGNRVVLVDTVRKSVDMHHLIAFNEAAKAVWDGIDHECFTLPDMVKAIREVYEVEEAVAKKNCAKLLGNWAQYGLVETVRR